MSSNSTSHNNNQQSSEAPGDVANSTNVELRQNSGLRQHAQSRRNSMSLVVEPEQTTPNDIMSLAKTASFISKALEWKVRAHAFSHTCAFLLRRIIRGRAIDGMCMGHTSMRME
jgi:hypothetical protein